MRKVLRKHDAGGSSCGSSWRPYVRLETPSRKRCGSTCQEIIAEGSVEARSFEVPTERKLVFAEAPQKLVGGRVVSSIKINKE